MNSIYLVGKVNSDIILNHYIGDNDFYSFEITSKRLSLVDDILTVVVLGKTMRRLKIMKGDFVEIEGEVRTLNQSGHVKIYVYPTYISKTDQPYKDEVIITGSICKDPINRITPFGSEITDIIIKACDKSEHMNYIPIVVWNSNSRKCKDYKKGDNIFIKGRLQSREYTKGDEIRTATELSATEIVRTD